LTAALRAMKAVKQTVMNGVARILAATRTQACAE